MSKNLLNLDRQQIVRGLIFSLGIGLMAFLLVFALTVDKNTITHFLSMKKAYLLLAAVVMILSAVVEGLRIKVVTHAVDERIGFWESVRIFFISFFLGGITPYFSGSIPGQVFLFVQQGIPIGKGTMIATIRPIMKSIIFVIMTPILFLSFRESLKGYAILSWLLLMAAILFSVFFIVLFMVAVKNPGKLTSLLEWLKKISFLRHYLSKSNVQKRMDALMSQVMQFHESFGLVLKHRKDMVFALFYTGIYWFLYFSIAPLLLLAMDFQLNYALVMVIQVLIFFIIPFLPVPGGSGAAELGFASLFSFFVPSHLLGIYVGGWRLFTFYLNILTGAILSLVALRKWAD